METIQMIPVFNLLFTLQLFVTFIFIFENSQNSFSCGPHFGPFWSVKYLNFGQELPSQSTHHIFLESRHAEVTKNPYYVLSPKWGQIKVSAHGLLCLHTKIHFSLKLLARYKIAAATTSSALQKPSRKQLKQVT